MTPMTAQGPATAGHAAWSSRDESPLPPRPDLDVWGLWEKVFDAARASGSAAADATVPEPAPQPVNGDGRSLVATPWADQSSNGSEARKQAPALAGISRDPGPSVEPASDAGARGHPTTPATVQRDRPERASAHPPAVRPMPGLASTVALRQEAHDFAPFAPDAHAAAVAAPRSEGSIGSDVPFAPTPSVDRLLMPAAPNAPAWPRPAAQAPAKLAPSEAATAASGSATPPERQDIARESVHVFQSDRAVAIVVRDASLSPDVAIRCALETAHRLVGERRALQHVTLNGRTVYAAPAGADGPTAMADRTQRLCFDG